MLWSNNMKIHLVYCTCTIDTCLNLKWIITAFIGKMFSQRGWPHVNFSFVSIVTLPQFLFSLAHILSTTFLTGTCNLETAKMAWIILLCIWYENLQCILFDCFLLYLLLFVDTLIYQQTPRDLKSLYWEMVCYIRLLDVVDSNRGMWELCIINYGMKEEPVTVLFIFCILTVACIKGYKMKAANFPANHK